jgi:hypothetical protein
MGESTEPEKTGSWIPAGIKSGFMKMYAGDKGRHYQPNPHAPVAATRLMHLRIIIRSAAKSDGTPSDRQICSVVCHR